MFESKSFKIKLWLKYRCKVGENVFYSEKIWSAGIIRGGEPSPLCVRGLKDLDYFFCHKAVAGIVL